jgi:hypothetical protein
MKDAIKIQGLLKVTMIIDIASRKEDISATLLEPIFCANKPKG